MLRVLIAGALLLAPAATFCHAFAARAGTPSIAVKDVVEICEAAARTADTPGQASAHAVCLAYIDAVVATVNQVTVLLSPDGQSRPPFAFCVGPEVGDAELRRTFVAFAQKNPQHLNLAAASLVMAALADRYPCR